MKPFNLEDFNEDSVVVTGTGQPVNIFTTEALGDYPVVGQYLDTLSVVEFTARGIYDIDLPQQERDLFFKTEKEVRYVAVLKGRVQTTLFKTEEACKLHYNPSQLDTVATLTWEE